MKSSRVYIPSFKESRWIRDLIFCTAAYFILLSMFASSSKWQMIDHIYTSIFLGTLILFGTINEWIIQKHFLQKNSYALFFILTACNILLGALFNQVLFDSLIDRLLPGYYFISYYEYVDLVKFFFVYIFLLTLLGLSWEWFQLQDTRHKMTLLQKEKIDAELKALTNQVNPHFLFNSLTVLYGLALKGSQETSNAIIKLSDILRYVIYDSSKNKATLASEIKLINDYIDLQRYRVSSASKISFANQIHNPEKEVEPMIFLPLVENAFKHGIKGDLGEKAFVDIELKSDSKSIHFKIANNKSDVEQTEKGPGGIGLKNIADRLKLMYPGQHSFSVESGDSIFTVNLILNTQG